MKRYELARTTGNNTRQVDTGLSVLEATLKESDFINSLGRQIPVFRSQNPRNMVIIDREKGDQVSLEFAEAIGDHGLDVDSVLGDFGFVRGHHSLKRTD